MWNGKYIAVVVPAYNDPNTSQKLSKRFQTGLIQFTQSMTSARTTH